jgi:hypothetical protein
LLLVNLPSAPFPFSFSNGDQFTRALILGEKNAALFEQLTNSGIPVPWCVFMPLRIPRWRTSSILKRQITPGKDVGRRKGCGCLDAMKEEDFVLR